MLLVIGVYTTLWWQRKLFIYIGLHQAGWICVVCVCAVSGSSIAKFPHIWWQRWDRHLKTSRVPSEKKEEEPERPATNYFVFYVFLIFILYLPIACVLLFVFLCLSPGGGLRFYIVLRITLGEHGWQGQQEATSTYGGHPGIE